MTELAYSKDGIDVWWGDCRDVLPALEPVDHVITDPPYAPRAMKNFRSASMIQRRDGEIRDFGYAGLTDELRAFTVAEAARLARRWVLIWTDIESAHVWRCHGDQKGLRYIRTGIWVREHGAPQFSGDRPAQGVEACYIGHHATNRLAWNGGGHPATWIGPIVNSQKARRGHTSPKPLWLMRHQIRQFTDPGDIVLDPFGGSMTTAVACKETGRRCITVEIDADWIESGISRIDATEYHETPPLFVLEPEHVEQTGLAL